MHIKKPTEERRTSPVVEGTNHRQSTDRTGIAPPMNRSHKMPSASSTRFQRVILDRNRGNPYPATNTNHNGLEPSRRRARLGTVTRSPISCRVTEDKGNYQLGGRAPYGMRFVFKWASNSVVECLSGRQDAVGSNPTCVHLLVKLVTETIGCRCN